MDTISQNDNESVKAPVKTSQKNSRVVSDDLNSPLESIKANSSKNKIIATATILALLLVIQIGPLRGVVFENSLFLAADNAAEEYIDQSFKRAMVTYATARGINAIISVLQESNLQLNPAGIGVTIAVGEALDPINDIVERFSWIVLASLLSLGIQKALVTIGPWLSISVLLNISLLCMLPALWLNHSFSQNLWAISKKTLFAALIFKLAMPCVAYLNYQVYDQILKDQYETVSETLDKEASSLQELNLEDDSIPPATERPSNTESQGDNNGAVEQNISLNAAGAASESAAVSQPEISYSSTPKSEEVAPKSGWWSRTKSAITTVSTSIVESAPVKDTIAAFSDGTGSDNGAAVENQSSERIEDPEKQGWWDRTKSTFSGAKNAVKKVASVKEKIATLKTRAGQIVDNFVRLSIVFLLNTIVIPILFLWGFIHLGRLLLSNTFGVGLEQTFKSKIVGRKPPEQPDLEAVAAQ